MYIRQPTIRYNKIKHLLLLETRSVNLLINVYPSSVSIYIFGQYLIAFPRVKITKILGQVATVSFKYKFINQAKINITRHSVHLSSWFQIALYALIVPENVVQNYPEEHNRACCVYEGNEA